MTFSSLATANTHLAVGLGSLLSASQKKVAFGLLVAVVVAEMRPGLVLRTTWIMAVCGKAFPR